MILAFLGRQPALGLAELERLLGPENVQPLTRATAIISRSPERECGGVMKFAEIFAETPSTKLPALLPIISKFIRDSTTGAEGKISLGVSFYDFPHATAVAATTLAYKLKKSLPTASVRNLQNTEAALSSAQVIHGKLLNERGFEIVILHHRGKTYLARTIREQNLAGYTARDQARPKRDAFVGMLPPKLAQIMINLAHPEPTEKTPLLDPFCGTGVVLQEALLYGFPIIGTDLSEKMVDFTRENLAWLKQNHPQIPFTPAQPQINLGDAMTHRWPQPLAAIVGEGYLGTPFSGEPAPEKLQSVIRNCNHILSTFLQNLATQIPAGTPLCLAFPCWFVRGQVYHLPLLDDLQKLGYNYMDFTHVRRSELVYHRESQIVGRELLVIKKR